MSKRSKNNLLSGLQESLDNRPDGRVASMMQTKPAVKSFAEISPDNTFDIDVERIKPDPDQPRKSFNQEQLEQLATSIRANGILQPITVYNDEEPGFYLIETGERRFQAAKLAGLTTVPAIVRNTKNDDLVLQRQIVENIQRADLDPIEAARALETYLSQMDLSQKQAAERLGKPRTWLVELLSILKLSGELLAKVEHARDDEGKRVSKQALVEIVRAPQERHEELIERALGSDTSLAAVRGTRNQATTTPASKFRQRYIVKGSPLSVTLAGGEPETITLEDQIKTLEKLLRELRKQSKV